MVLVSSSFSGVLEAAQRFDLLNFVRIPLSASTFLLPLVGLELNFELPGIVTLILIVRLMALLILVAFAIHLFSELGRIRAHLALFRRLFSYGGWITVSSFIGPILVYIDRFMIGSLLSIAAVTYYTAPYEAVTRLWIIPFSLNMTLFPVFSILGGRQDREKVGTVFAGSLKYTLLVLGPIVLMILLFAEKILQVWLGGDFPIQSTGPFRVLAVGVLINSLANVPYVLLQGMGRPDIPAKCHLLELPIHIWVAWTVINDWGIVGAAAAWTLRMVLDAILLFVATFKVCRFSPDIFARNGVHLSVFILLLVAAIAYGLKIITSHLPFYIQALLFITLFILFFGSVWRKILDASDRGALVNVIKEWKR
jgi:O-antigen/teichoic acid export membrane protein